MRLPDDKPAKLVLCASVAGFHDHPTPTTEVGAFPGPNSRRIVRTAARACVDKRDRPHYFL